MLSFVGWGGLAEVFDETSDAYAAERERLKAGLTEREYAKARESTLTAYYTPIEVARAVWDYLAMAGFSAGNVLDPAAGTGRVRRRDAGGAWPASPASPWWSPTRCPP